MRPGIAYRFNIINCEKSNSQFNYGETPAPPVRACRQLPVGPPGNMLHRFDFRILNQPVVIYRISHRVANVLFKILAKLGTVMHVCSCL